MKLHITYHPSLLAFKNNRTGFNIGYQEWKGPLFNPIKSYYNFNGNYVDIYMSIENTRFYI